MRTLFLTGRELSYSRNDVLCRAFQRVSEVDVLSVSKRPTSLFLNSLRVLLKALPKLIFRKYDLIFVGFYGHLLMLPVSLFARAPVLFDAFVSTYDTFVEDRQTFSKKSIPGRLAAWLDRRACIMANHVLLDTPLHVRYFVDEFGLPPERLSALPVGCNETMFYPRLQLLSNEQHTRVLYYCSYLPLHGVEFVIRAANLLRSQTVRFRLIGGGPTYAAMRRLVGELNLTNIDFVPFVALEELPLELSQADICLGGHFGTNEKAGRVVPGKIYQILAMGRPLIAGQTPANQYLLTHGQDAWLCPPGDSHSLSQAINALHQDVALRNRIAAAGRHLYDTVCSEAIITRKLIGLIG